MPPETEQQKILVTAADARKFEQLAKYQQMLDIYRGIMRDRMSKGVDPTPEAYEWLKAYVIAMYVDLKPEIDKREEFKPKFSKLEALIEADKPVLGDGEAVHFFILIREMLGQMGVT